MKSLVYVLMMVVCLMTMVPAAGLSAQGAEQKAVAAKTAEVAVNSATAEQLQTLPGIGAVTARRILEYRQAHGPFASVDDLLQVKGVGPHTLERIRGRISLN